MLDLGSLFSRGLLFMDVRVSALLHLDFILLFLLFHGFDSDLEQVSIVLDLSVLHNFWLFAAVGRDVIDLIIVDYCQLWFQY